MPTLDQKIIDTLKKDSETKGKEIDGLASSLKRTEGYMIGITVVAAFGFVTLLMTGWAFFADSLRFKASTYQVLIEKVNMTNEKIDRQNDILYKDEINLLQAQITSLKQKNPYLK